MLISKASTYAFENEKVCHVDFMVNGGTIYMCKAGKPLKEIKDETSRIMFLNGVKQLQAAIENVYNRERNV